MGQYSIETGLYQERTILKDTYFTPPFNVVEIREDKTNPLMEVMIMSSSPGFFNLDDYKIEINVKTDTLLNLQTQSYQRVYDTPDGARQEMKVIIEEDAYFSHVPHPSVPHKGAIFESKNNINLAKNSVLIWGEILACGRKLNGESFAFTKYSSLTEIYREGKLFYKDNLYLKPSAVDFKTLGQYETFTYQANFVSIDPFHSAKDRMAFISTVLAEEEDILFGVSQLSEDACALRVLGNSGEQLFSALKKIQKQLDKHANALRKKEIELKLV
ncbi:urease accessory protein [Oceanihabitans sediminis]|uniref:Urease accessory protein UreD n=1 Tax=Oceanihabitans sediminis TaxID=1812012 RepID=A0A368P1D2_9FLAO|nr:urease accessory protein UreD [Oceanihabitans sediminis]MDX1774649.1 urease accessory protein UreD [Oceanihabitans sediminis]RBP28470.1 urease accessory protein [Oceanihabitans sediminis]RCU56667.1 urease accessory protein UreD [Oceanihabitans sediminis]